MKFILKNFLSDESGVTAIEYGLIAALISVIIVGAFTAFKGDLDAMFESLGKTLNDPAADLESSS